MDKTLNIDYERGTATVPITNGPTVLLINQGKAKIFFLHDYGEFVAKTHEGKISHYAVTETGKF